MIFGSSEMELLETRVRSLGDVAVVHVRWRITGQTRPDGSPAGQRHGIFCFVLQRQSDGGWLAVSAQNTDQVPDAETMVAGDGVLVPRNYLTAGR